MKFAYRYCIGLGASLSAAIFSLVFAFPSVYPTGTTIYQPDKSWSGYTVFGTPNECGVVLMDMNGNEVKHWPSVADAFPARIFPGGNVMGSNAPRRPFLEGIALIQVDRDGNEVWRFDKVEEVTTKEGKTCKVPGRTTTGSIRCREFSLLQPLRKLRAATSQRKYAGHGRSGRPHL